MYRVDDTSQVGEARRAGEALADALGLKETDRGTLAIIITEVATNLARHARQGRILLSPVGTGASAGVQVIAIDEGPGIANVGRALEDGYSTGGTSGHGLGAIRRMATSFDIYSRPGDKSGSGTIIEATVRPSSSARAPLSAAAGAEFGVVCTSYDWGRVCGDAWLVLEQRERTLVVIADGLGHGPEAATASSEAIRVICDMSDASLTQMVDASHLALRATRGAACAIASIRPDQRAIEFAGIGNITAALHFADGTTRSLASLNGTVGHSMRKVQEFRYECPLGGLLLMHSDGINSRWKLDNYPGLTQHHPALSAGAVFRDALRGTDDATVIALRIQPG
jgi:anti-sigma regulatory factor (Ser/Thr protein kinase)